MVVFNFIWPEYEWLFFSSTLNIWYKIKYNMRNVVFYFMQVYSSADGTG
jgi:hypothetical protein